MSTVQVTVTASQLRTMDVCAGSGFTVTHNAYRALNERSNKVSVQGYYPSGVTKTFHWNRGTRITVLRESQPWTQVRNSMAY